MTGDIKQYFIDHITACLESAGEDPTKLRERIEELAQKKIDKVDEILEDGLDIGGVAQHRIKVSLVYDSTHEWCFDAGKRYGLYRILDQS